MTKDRTNRQDAIKRIVRNENIKTQREMVNALKRQGINCTQATVSRDISELGLAKLPEGMYTLAEDLRLHSCVSQYVVKVDRTESLVVVHTAREAAREVAEAIDATHFHEVMGTVAGLDTIFVATRSAEEGYRFAERIRRISDAMHAR